MLDYGVRCEPGSGAAAAANYRRTHAVPKGLTQA